MNLLCDDLYCVCADFLEVQDFMMLSRVNKISRIKMKQMIIWRKPYIRVDKCIRMKKEVRDFIGELIKNNEKSSIGYDNQYDGVKVHAILKFGANNLSTNDNSYKPGLSAVPWVFRKHMDYEIDLDIGWRHVIRYDKFICDKMLKYRNKIDNIDDLDIKAKKKIYYFDKLEKWQIKIENYRKTKDRHMIAYNDRLDTLIY